MGISTVPNVQCNRCGKTVTLIHRTTQYGDRYPTICPECKGLIDGLGNPVEKSDIECPWCGKKGHIFFRLDNDGKRTKSYCMNCVNWVNGDGTKIE